MAQVNACAAMPGCVAVDYIYLSGQTMFNYKSSAGSLGSYLVATPEMCMGTMVRNGELMDRWSWSLMERL